MSGQTPPPNSGWTPAPSGRPNTVGLHERELGELLDRFDAPEAGPGNPKRDFVRWPFRRTSVQVRLIHPSGAITSVSVACRNISRGGVSAIHNAYLHPGTKCRIALPHPQHGHKQIDGQVVRCHHRSGMIHEIGIAFKEPIDVREFIRADPLADCFSLERVKPEELTGTIMVVDASEIDRRIYKHFLRETPLKIITVESAEEAIVQLDDTFDLVIADLAVARDRGFVNSLHERAPVPVIIASSDTGAEARRAMTEIAAAAFVAKPLTQRLLMRAIAEILIVRRAGKATAKGGGGLPDDIVPHLAQNFISGLAEMGRRIEDAAKRGEAAACRNLCLQISGTAPTVGFKPLGRLAATAAQLLSKTQSVKESLSAVRAVISACERALDKVA